MLFFTIVLIAVSAVAADIPSFIHVCKRNDPKVEDCVINSINELMPYLLKGIPELNVPPIDPLTIKEVEVANEKDATRLRIYGHDLKVKGASKFQIQKLRVDIPSESRLIIHVDLLIPQIEIDGDYDLNAKLLVLPLNGRGQIHVDAVNTHADAIIHGQVYKKGGNNYLRFSKADMDLTFKDFDIKLSNLFGGDKTLGEVANRIIKDNKAEFGKTLTPLISRTVSRVILDIANKVTVTAPYDKLFPPN